MADPDRYRPRAGFRLVVCQSFIHYISKKVVKRKDGKPFAFWVRCKK